MNVGIAILVIFFAVMLLISYIFSEAVLCYYQTLPVDDYILKSLAPNFNSKFDERIKQVWTFTYIPCSHNILEFGFGNTTSTLNLNKRLSPSIKHVVIVPPSTQKHQKLLEINRQITHTTFQITQEIPTDAQELSQFKTVVVHLDGQHLFWNLIKSSTDILKSTEILVLEIETSLMLSLKPILDLYNFKKLKTYIYLSVWYKDNMSTEINEVE